jgi:asparagine synthase (glutamine-hydrolysing)
MPNYLLNKIISSENNFIFTGEGGDPCLGGPKNNAMLMASFYGPGFGDNEDNYLEISYLNSFKRCYDDLSSALPESFRADQTRMIEFLRPYLRDQNLESFTNRLLLSNIKLKATSLIMPKVHKTTLAFGNLSVSPLYTRKIIESSMSVPAKYKMHRGDEKYILKQVMGRTVPDEILARPKSGMRVPLRIWSSNEMVNFNREYIHSHKALINEWFDYNYINKLIDPTMRDAPIKRAGLKLWMITTFLMYLTNIKQTNNH